MNQLTDLGDSAMRESKMPSDPVTKPLCQFVYGGIVCLKLREEHTCCHMDGEAFDHHPTMYCHAFDPYTPPAETPRPVQGEIEPKLSNAFSTDSNATCVHKVPFKHHCDLCPQPVPKITHAAEPAETKAGPEELGTCAGFCECYKVPHRKTVCTGDNWKPLGEVAPVSPEPPTEDLTGFADFGAIFGHSSGEAQPVSAKPEPSVPTWLYRALRTIDEANRMYVLRRTFDDMLLICKEEIILTASQSLSAKTPEQPEILKLLKDCLGSLQMESECDGCTVDPCTQCRIKAVIRAQA